MRNVLKITISALAFALVANFGYAKDALSAVKDAASNVKNEAKVAAQAVKKDVDAKAQKVKTSASEAKAKVETVAKKATTTAKEVKEAVTAVHYQIEVINGSGMSVEVEVPYIFQAAANSDKTTKINIPSGSNTRKTGMIRTDEKSDGAFIVTLDNKVALKVSKDIPEVTLGGFNTKVTYEESRNSIRVKVTNGAEASTLDLILDQLSSGWSSFRKSFGDWIAPSAGKDEL